MGDKKETTPKTYQVRISLNALQNIDEITGYIAFINQQPLNAIKVGDSIFKIIDRIANTLLLLSNVRRSQPKLKCTVKRFVYLGL